MTAPARPAPRGRAEPTPTADRPKLRVLDSADERRRRRTVVLITAAGGAVLATLLGVLYLQVVMLQRQRQLDDIAAQRTEVVREYQDLRRNVAQLESPDAVVKRATEELGMVPAPEVLYLEPAAATAPAEPLNRTLGDGIAAPAQVSPAASGGTEGPAGPGAAEGDSTDDASTDVASTDVASTDDASTDDAAPPESTNAPEAAGSEPQVDPATGLPIDPATGKTRYDPVTGLSIDPTTGQPVTTGQGAGT
ncbi:MAG: hypothetical protein KDB24_09345 [Microthrixaceae bacterium]|nr:hypothetical protein [Microthrixaceae bacterium]